MYDDIKEQLTEAQFDLWWLECAEASMMNAKEDMPEIEQDTLNWVKSLSDEECLQKIKEM